MSLLYKLSKISHRGAPSTGHSGPSHRHHSPSADPSFLPSTSWAHLSPLGPSSPSSPSSRHLQSTHFQESSSSMAELKGRDAAQFYQEAREDLVHMAQPRSGLRQDPTTRVCPSGLRDPTGRTDQAGPIGPRKILQFHGPIEQIIRPVGLRIVRRTDQDQSGYPSPPLNPGLSAVTTLVGLIDQSQTRFKEEIKGLRAHEITLTGQVIYLKHEMVGKVEKTEEGVGKLIQHINGRIDVLEAQNSVMERQNSELEQTISALEERNEKMENQMKQIDAEMEELYEELEKNDRLVKYACIGGILILGGILLFK